MLGLFTKYYFDVTRYNVIFSTIIIILTGRLTAGIVTFATVGIFVSFLVYRQLNNLQYYFYINGGLSKKKMMLKVALINFIIGLIITILIRNTL